jgi:peptide/nickel transport system substrate-binding protein
MRWEFNVDKANQILDAGGWKRGADGVRAKDGKRLKMLYRPRPMRRARRPSRSSSRPPPRSGSRSRSNPSWPRCSSDPTPPTPTTIPHFYADLQMLTEGPTQPDAQYFMNRFVSWEHASKANKWQGAT